MQSAACLVVTCNKGAQLWAMVMLVLLLMHAGDGLFHYSREMGSYNHTSFLARALFTAFSTGDTGDAVLLDSSDSDPLNSF